MNKKMLFFVFLIASGALYFIFLQSDHKNDSEKKKLAVTSEISTAKTAKSLQKDPKASIKTSKADVKKRKTIGKKTSLAKKNPAKAYRESRRLSSEKKKKFLKDKRIISFNNQKIAIIDDYFAIRKNLFDPSMGKKIKDLQGHTIFSAATKPQNNHVKIVSMNLNGGNLGVITGKLSVIYKDISKRKEIEQKYELSVRRETASIGMVSYFEGDLDSLMKKQESLSKESDIKYVNPEIAEY